VSLTTALLLVVAGYLIGSISFARLVTRLVTPDQRVDEFEMSVAGTDERYRTPSIGANAVSIRLGGRTGMVVALLDILKIAVPTLGCRLFLNPGDTYAFVIALAGTAGHIWPVYHRFHGGTGFSPTMGALLVLDWPAVVVLPVAGLVLGLVVLRSLLFITLGWLVLLIPWLWLRFQDPAAVVYAVGANVLVALAMVPETRLALKYRREGKWEAYGEGSLEATPMGRGILKMARRLGLSLKW
jgi:acyl phosphate:glycerol-3-phosphate acyltransferase